KSPQVIPLHALNALFAHPESQRQTVESSVVSQCENPVSIAETSSTPESPGRAKSALSAKSPSPYQPAFHALERRCPALVEPKRWQQAVEDGRQFLAAWSEQANAFGWTARELFGLHPVPERPAANYSRLSRLDYTGLIWCLRGRPVVAVTATEVAYRCPSGAILKFYRANKPTAESAERATA
ncbi:MAG: hypothetical protein ACLP19_15870, partial [Xanthobacteraceae bacterium]